MESFDVTSLYTNVSNDSAMQAAHEFLTEHCNSISLYGLSVMLNGNTFGEALKKANLPKRWPKNKDHTNLGCR
ncbi:hypothetical protein Y032_0031g2425 [Ancylostoma ceylanicum]|uniref:Reverse transcriptase domain-containing protein n=1 Tax=Ancylostoma ceylanicum TaxID=53326 RepID=A0A016UQ74_9BILA|nr:hypothetical protein Y032_0031g2425 [Ancylostoma ceylanicum]